MLLWSNLVAYRQDVWGLPWSKVEALGLLEDPRGESMGVALEQSRSVEPTEEPRVENVHM